MNNTFKTSRLQAAAPISKTFIALLIFYFVALAISQTKLYTSIYYLKIFLPILIIVSIYLMSISGSSQIIFTENSLKLIQSFGKNRETEVKIEDIKLFVQKHGIVEDTISKIFNVYFFCAVPKTNDNDTIKKLSLISQYMAFSNPVREQFKAYIKNTKMPLD